ncbi:hypothetical protein LAZ67_5000237 [Cordylochernes scorpioides]|uniref:HTH CENPB-type domain-containing protein n=1 Tax=Cordylochernes scorpioides TaxID=51811 RepID=A0ABY6KEY2_9ARAC|nr:hypothetical protein LAZ67_5000237 [Cordylochernes scorpioides]
MRLMRESRLEDPNLSLVQQLSVTPAKGLTIISKLRTSLHENMEKLLMVWVTEKQLQGDTLTQTIICEKARAIYGDLLKQTPQTSIDEASKESFKASRGCKFSKFQQGGGYFYK